MLQCEAAGERNTSIYPLVSHSALQNKPKYSNLLIDWCLELFDKHKKIKNKKSSGRKNKNMQKLKFAGNRLRSQARLIRYDSLDFIVKV